MDFSKEENVFHNLSSPELYEEAIKNGEAILTDDMALRVLTGTYTGRSPRDRYIVNEPNVSRDIDWGDINQPVSETVFNKLYNDVQSHLGKQQLYVKDMFAGADNRYRLNVRIVSEVAYHGLFVHNLFISPSKQELQSFVPDFTVLAAPNFKTENSYEGLNSRTFIIISFKHRIVLIGGTLYSGEIKKSIFSVMNYLLPKKNVMSMHCSVNMSKEGDSAIFFGLSGTGKTTLSSDPNRILIGDDEHGWSEEGVFNLEGGCYAKTINLSKEEEPLIYAATKRAGTILENVVLNKDRQPQFKDDSFTQNTRCAYPIQFIPNSSITGIGGHPSHILFLTCDAYGVLPPLSKMSTEQALYHFISGYTAKVAGTERGVIEPQATFSACFGAPFMPLNPLVYADLLANKIREQNVQVWLLNTGWTGGQFGDGKRIALRDTRQMLSEVLKNNVNNVEFRTDPVFGLSIPSEITNISPSILNPRDTWENKKRYDETAGQLVNMFNENFQKYSDMADDEIIRAGPN